MAGLDPAMRFPSLGDNPLGKVRGFMGAPSPSKESDFGGTTQCLGWLTESPNKGATHAVRITKAGTSGYRLDRFSSALDLFAGRFEPQPLDILGGSRAGFGRNATDAEFVLTSARSAPSASRRCCSMSARIAAGLRRVRSGRSSSGDREFALENNRRRQTGPPEMVPRRDRRIREAGARYSLREPLSHRPPCCAT